eukprot:TRINITY_DN8322_c0_g1_i1.p1 TRINITY_DN8322_c0_g1~~TRINITY_DN8322_c0_g1_i1.p1  ORF type:complete len:1150 (+),score=232.72 TRINITY_DN8322_c0_g1_i1:180-3629(+)
MQLNHKGTLKEIQQLFEELDQIAIHVGDQPAENKPQKKQRSDASLLFGLDGVATGGSPNSGGSLAMRTTTGIRASSIRGALGVSPIMARLKSHHHKLTPFQERIEHILETLASVELFYTRCSWAQIFYHRMMHSKNVISEKTLMRYIELISDYCHFFSSFTNDKKPTMKTAESLLEYLESHMMDPDSSLIGMPPCKEIIAKFLAHEANDLGEHVEFVKRTPGGARHNRGYALSCAGIIIQKGDLIIARVSKGGVSSSSVASPSSTSPPASPTSASPPSSPPKYNHGFEYLRQQNANSNNNSGGNNNNNSTPASPEVVRVASGCAWTTAVVATAAAAAEGRGGKICYCRLASEQIENGAFVAVWVTPDESKVERVKTSSILPFPSEMRPLLGSAKTMQKLVQDSVDEFYQMMNNKIDEQIAVFYDRLGVSDAPALFQRCSTNRATLCDLTSLRSIHATLQQIISGNASSNAESLFQELLDGIDKMAREKISEFMSSHNLVFYLPLKDNSIQQLTTFPFREFARNKLQSFVGVFESAVDQVQLQKRELLSGQTKRRLTEWWLAFIDHRAERLLKANGYDFNAVPEDYIEKAPTNIQNVITNLKIVQSIISPSKTAVGTSSPQYIQRAVSQVRENVYPKIDEFITHAIITLQDQFKLPIHPSLSFDFKAIKEKLDTERKEMEEAMILQIEGLIKDVDYLREMKRIEEITEEKERMEDGGGAVPLALSHVVPISGLFMSCFYRLENELKTVIELWSHDDIASKERRTAIAMTPRSQNLKGGSRIGVNGVKSSSTQTTERTRRFRRRRAVADKMPTLNIGSQRTNSTILPSNVNLTLGDNEKEVKISTQRPSRPPRAFSPPRVEVKSENTFLEEEFVDDDDEEFPDVDELAGIEANPPLIADITKLSISGRNDILIAEDTSRTTDEDKIVRVVSQTYPNGDTYEGEFVNGKRHGKGKYTFSSGDVFEGQHEQGQFSGYGTYRYVNGDVYNGQFKCGVFEGQGVFTGSDYQYMGQFSKDQMCGRGIITYSCGDRYVGEFQNDLRNGRGTYTYANGSRYDGEFVDGEMCGEGTHYYSNGDLYQGTFKNSKYHGQGRIEFSNGDILEGEFRDGEVVDEKGFFGNKEGEEVASFVPRRKATKAEQHLAVLLQKNHKPQ